MDAIMHGIDPQRKPNRPTDPKAGGARMQSLLSGDSDAAEREAAADPFAHLRGGRQRVTGCQPADGLARSAASLAPSGGPRYGQPASADQLTEHTPLAQRVGIAYDAVCRAVAAAPRDEDGRLSDYRPLLGLLEQASLPVTTDGAGTLIAIADVRREVTFSEFLECLGLVPAAPEAGSSAAAGADAGGSGGGSTSDAELPACPEPTWRHLQMTAAAQHGMGGGGSSEWRGADWQMTTAPPRGGQPRDVEQALHSARAEMAGISGRADGSEAGSLGLARLLNGNTQQFARHKQDAELGVDPRRGSTRLRHH